MCFDARAGSWVVRIDPLRFLAGCRKKVTKPGSVSLIFQHAFIVLLFIRALFMYCYAAAP